MIEINIGYSYTWGVERGGAITTEEFGGDPAFAYIGVPVVLKSNLRVVEYRDDWERDDENAPWHKTESSKYVWNYHSRHWFKHNTVQ